MLNHGFDTISQDGWCAFRSEVTPGTHDVKHTDPDVTFSVIVYGFKFRYGYAYTAGFNAISGEFCVKESGFVISCCSVKASLKF